MTSGHFQTLSAVWWPGELAEHRAVARHVTFDDGDAVVVHDDCPASWRPGDRIALLMHGLSGCHRSPLLVRLAAKLTERGVRVFRWDMRGCGAGAALALHPYHAGRSDDLARVVEAVLAWCASTSEAAPSRLTLVGVSLSGNILLKYLGEAPDRVPRQVARAIAVNPPIDLARSIATLDRPINRWYDRYFVGALLSHLAERQRMRPDLPMPDMAHRPRRLYDFDDWYTAPISGFPNAATYYKQSSAAQFLPHVRVPTSIITSRNDPMVPVEMFDPAAGRWSPSVRLSVTDGGGHVGYIARRGNDPDPFWLDWRIVELVTTNRETD
jgi:uncharacterized protein